MITAADRILDALDQAVLVLDRQGRVAYANRRAAHELAAAGGAVGRPVPWEEAASIAAEARRFGEEVRRTGVAAGAEEGSFAGRFVPIGGGGVAVLLDPEPGRGGRERVLEQRLGLNPEQARLALRVAEGRSNRDLAAELSIPVGAVKGRLWRIYRRLGVRNRAELSALVVASGRGPD